MLTRRILTLIAATLITLTAALTIAGSTSGTASAMRIPPPCSFTHTC
jgi:hypothetical protein